jgi:hypothetical protein
MLPAVRRMGAQIDFGVPPSIALSFPESSLSLSSGDPLFRLNSRKQQLRLISLALQCHLIECSHYGIGISVV